MDKVNFELELSAVGYLIDQAFLNIRPEHAPRIREVIEVTISEALFNSLDFVIEQSEVYKFKNDHTVTTLGMDDFPTGAPFPISPAGTDPKIPFRCIAKCPEKDCSHPPIVVVDAKFLNCCKCPIHNRMMKLYWK